MKCVHHHSVSIRSQVISIMKTSLVFLLVIALVPLLVYSEENKPKEDKDGPEIRPPIPCLILKKMRDRAKEFREHLCNKTAEEPENKGEETREVGPMEKVKEHFCKKHKDGEENEDEDDEGEGKDDDRVKSLRCMMKNRFIRRIAARICTMQLGRMAVRRMKVAKKIGEYIKNHFCKKHDKEEENDKEEREIGGGKGGRRKKIIMKFLRRHFCRKDDEDEKDD